MALTLDPATEQRFQQELEAGGYRSPSDLVAHLLDLSKEAADQATARAAFLARLDESIAQAERGEGISGEQLRARFEARKATHEKSVAIAG
jgi:Arc/MetJ-type ribon-helix-helix transcriptional regulator